MKTLLLVLGLTVAVGAHANQFLVLFEEPIYCGEARAQLGPQHLLVRCPKTKTGKAKPQYAFSVVYSGRKQAQTLRKLRRTPGVAAVSLNP